MNSEQSPSLSSSSCPSRLKHFLDDLATKPNDPPLDLNEPDLKSTTSHAQTASLNNIATISNQVDQTQNPEADSFAYLEILLESLAVLGKLGSALDVVAQRLPTEVYSLVEQTVDEVHERAELSRRSTFYSSSIQGRPSSVYVFAGDHGSADLSSSALDASALRLAALEPSEKRSDYEVLRDLFWTLYSKLDAVTQGLRVVYEISNRIGSVSSSRRSGKLTLQHLIFPNPISRGEISRIPRAPNRVLSFLCLICGFLFRVRYVHLIAYPHMPPIYLYP